MSEGKTVLLVGAGFLGKFFVQDWLTSSATNKLIILDKVDEGVFFSHPAVMNFQGDTRIKYLWGNSGDPEQLEPYLPEIDDIVYTAAIADVPYAEKNPRDAHRINVENTGTFMEYLGHMKFKGRIVLMSSESVYKKKECLPVEKFPPESIAFKETDELGPHSVYGETKLQQETIARLIAERDGLRLVVIRSATMYGMYARPKQVIPAYIKQLLTDQPITMLGTGEETSRDFIYVMDTANAIKSVLEADKSIDGEIFNIGTGRETKLLNLANAMKEICGQPSEPYEPKTGAPRMGYKPIIHLDHRPGEKGARIVLDISKAKEKLKMLDRNQIVPWEPKTELIYGLRNTIYWMASTLGYDEKEMEDIHRNLYPEKYRDRTEANPKGNRA